MSEETKKRIAKLYQEGKWNKKDKVAEMWAKQYNKTKENNKNK